MNLTDKQARRIGQYLKDVADELGDVEDELRNTAMAQVRTRIREELNQFAPRNPDDDDVERVLQACGTPKGHAAYVLGRTKPNNRPAESETPRPQTPPRVEAFELLPEEGRFLGACAGLGHHFDVSPWMVRALFLLLLLTGPFAVIAYLACYAFMYTRTHPDRAPRIDLGKVVYAGVAYFLVTLAIHVGVSLVLWGVRYVYEHPSVGGSIPGIGYEWTWIYNEKGGAFFWTVLFSIPLAIFSALPVHDAWAKTIRKLAQVTIALYAVYLAYGMGALLAGIGINEASRAQGIDPVQLLSDWLY